jgi:hypothetical protein
MNQKANEKNRKGTPWSHCYPVLYGLLGSDNTDLRWLLQRRSPIYPMRLPPNSLKTFPIKPSAVTAVGDFSKGGVIH